ncbi:cytochrome c oxidase assembly protein COX11, mitochondrial-like [Tigriopus californicus]|nr:cytochrome c oxidase assembly protein COX11, mitochondrial-like [Tigriopus californicus]
MSLAMIVTSRHLAQPLLKSSYIQGLFRRPPIRTQFDFSKRGSNRPLPKTRKQQSRTTLFYVMSMAIGTVGLSYAAVPLYRIFCQSTGYGGTVKQGHDAEKVAELEPKKNRLIRVEFNADTAATMRWNFRPQQSVIYLNPGETALAFYTAKNPTDKPIDGISTYNVVPYEAGQYFNKIQCFCLEEQRLNPNEEVDMPVFFYIDPDFDSDPFLENVDSIVLSYTFFESKPGMKLPLNPYVTKS